MISAIEKIEKYIEIIRQVIVEKSMKKIKNGHSFNDMMAAELQIKERQVPKILSALDIIGDTNEAILNFDKLGLNGVSNNAEVGEKYLRLYGILNAINMHCEAILALSSVFQVGNNLRKDSSIDIINIRSKLSGHSTSHTSKDNDLPQAYAPIRMQIDNKNISYINMNPENGKYESVDLEEQINIYLKAVLIILNDIVLKILLVASDTELNCESKLRKTLDELELKGQN